MKVDLLLHSATQLVTCASADGRPKRGAALRDVNIIPDGAVAVADGVIVAVGASDDLRAAYQAAAEIDAAGQVVCPGFVDCHTHVVYAGDRVGEFEARIAGATYLEILAAGGGILSTMQAVRAATIEHLCVESAVRLDAMLALGATTVEAKTGYGLNFHNELKTLVVTGFLDRSHPIDLVPTFLGAHAVPPEYTGNADGYAWWVAEVMMPAVATWYADSHFVRQATPCFVDVFCERNAFDVAQTRRVLAAGKAAGLAVKAHVDEFTALGGLELALALGAVSVDHLDVTTAAGMARLAQSDAIGVVMPAVNFNLGSTHFADARGLVDAGAAIALATDINPGSAPCPSLPLVMALACRYQKLLPAETLNAVTINAAHAVGLGDRIGSLEPGKQADLLVVAAPDYRHLAYQFGGNLVRRVIKRGKVVI
jgi:imidazolonepropionase